MVECDIGSLNAKTGNSSNIATCPQEIGGAAPRGRAESCSSACQLEGQARSGPGHHCLAWHGFAFLKGTLLILQLSILCGVASPYHSDGETTSILYIVLPVPRVQEVGMVQTAEAPDVE